MGAISSDNLILHYLSDEKQTYAPQAKALLRHYLIDPKDLDIGECIGEGSSGVVYQGSFKGEKVAIKQLKGLTPGSKVGGEFRREVLSLISCAHKNVLKLYGVCLCPDRGVCIVTKFMEGGSLLCYLQQKKSLKLKEIVHLAKDVARGMEFLHSKGVIHMDLKTANVFLDDKENAVIGDLGVARLANEKVNANTEVMGSYRWMAPEVCGAVSGAREDGSFSFKSDVYSFGILLWELVTCKIPYADYDPVQAAVGVVMHSLRPTIPQNCFPPIRYLIQKCWDQNPDNRPHFSEILKMLDIIACHQ